MEAMGETRGRSRRAARAVAARPVSLAWMLSGDASGGVFRRSLLLLGAGATLWVAALTFINERLLGDVVPGPLTERLLLGVEDAGTHPATPLFAHPPTKVPAPLRRAIRDAAERVGVDRLYLFAVAARESSFDAKAYAARTSAAGLYQFTEETWLRVVKVFGARHGLGRYAAAISLDADGSVAMPAGALRARLMQLRFDPRIASLMAAELARDNERRLAYLLGRPVSPAETYLAHFLGLHQAARMITAAALRPHVAAAHLVPVAAAAANPAVFSGAGRPISARAVVRAVEAYFRDEVPLFARA
jgi:hypothetical protein